MAESKTEEAIDQLSDLCDTDRKPTAAWNEYHIAALAHLIAEARKVPGLVKALSEIARLYHGVEISGEPFAPDDEEWQGAIDAARAALKAAKP